MVTIKYNSVSIETPIEKFHFSQSYTSVVIATKVLVTGTSASNLIGKCEDLEELCQLKNKRVQLNFGGSTEYDYNPVATTGFTSRVTLKKIRSESDLELSRIYELKIGLEIPYTEEGFGYRRDANFVVTLVPSLHKIAVFKVDYTSGGGFSGLTNYNTAVTGGRGWAETILAEMGGDWILIKEQINEEQERNLLSATIVYHQLLSTCRIFYNEEEILTPVYKFGFSQNYKSVKLSSPILIKGVADPEAIPPVTASENLIEKCTALEELCQLRNKAVKLIFNGTTEYDYDPFVTNGFNAVCTLKKSEGFFDQETTRLYYLFIDLQIPYPEEDFGYRREGNFLVSTAPNGRRTVQFWCEYTTGGANQALANYNDEETGGKSWAESILEEILDYEGDECYWDLIYENIEEDQFRNVVKAQLIYKEILYGETLNDFAVSYLQDVKCDYEVIVGQKRGNPLTLTGISPKPLSTVNFKYRAIINQEKLPDDMEEIYRKKIRPYIFSQVKTLLGLDKYGSTGFTLIVTDDSYKINPYTKELQGFLNAITTLSPNECFIYTEKITQMDYRNMIEQEIWNGIDFTCNLYSLGKTRYLTRLIKTTKFGDFFSENDIPLLPEKAGLTGHWIFLDKKETRHQEEYSNTVNLADATTTKVSHQQIIEQYKYVEELNIIEEDLY